MLEYVMYKRFKSKREKDEKEKGEKGKHKFTPEEPPTSSPTLDEASPVLTAEDEAFLATILDDAEHRPALPPRLRTPHISLHSSDDEASTPTAERAPASPDYRGKARAPDSLVAGRPNASADDDAKSKRSRLAFLFRQDKPESSKALTLRIPNAKLQLQKILPGRSHSQSRSHAQQQPQPQPPASRPQSPPQSPQPQPEYEEPEDAQRKQEEEQKKKEEDLKRREAELAEVLEDLNMGTKGNRAFSLSAESAEMARKFNQVLRDLVEGVPTAYHDLTHLLDDKDGTLTRAYDKLPSPMKKMVEQLPEKIAGVLGPEVLVAAAEAGGIKVAMDHSAARSGTKGAAKKAVESGVKSMLTPGNLQKLIAKPGAIASMLRAIVTALKTRWPAFISTNILFSVSVFLLLFVLWYCYKRGRETRLERESRVDSEGRIVEIEIEVEEVDDAPEPKDPLLLAASESAEPRRRRRKRADAENHNESDRDSREREGEGDRGKEGGGNKNPSHNREHDRDRERDRGQDQDDSRHDRDNGEQGGQRRRRRRRDNEGD